MATRRKKKGGFRETFVIYESAEDGCWVAHGVSTDQIGTGDCIVEAIVGYMRAIEHVIQIAAEGKDIAIRRLAPPEVRAMAKNAPSLPKEIYEIAHKQVYGKWPDDLPVKVDPPPKHPFKWAHPILVAERVPG